MGKVNKDTKTVTSEIEEDKFDGSPRHETSDGRTDFPERSKFQVFKYLDDTLVVRQPLPFGLPYSRSIESTVLASTTTTST